MRLAIKGNLKFLLLYLGIVFLYFVHLPLNYSIPGCLDCWANLGMFKNLGNFLQSYFSGVETTCFNYPTSNMWVHYGLDFFTGIIFLGFKWIGFNDVWAYFGYIVVLVSFNAFAVFLLVKQIFRNNTAAFFGGAFFVFSNFMLGNIDNPNYIFIAPGILASTLLFKTYKANGVQYLGFSFVMLALQLLLAPVSLVYSLILYAIFGIYQFPNLAYQLTHFRKLIPYILVSILFAIPYIKFYILGSVTECYAVTSEPYQYAYISLNLNDLLRVQPNNLLINFTNFYGYYYISIIKTAYIGIGLALFAVIGFSRLGKKYKFVLGSFVLFGLLLSLGPYVCNKTVPLFKSPLFWLYDILPIDRYQRIPARAFILVSIGISVLGGIGFFTMLKSANKYVAALSLALVSLVILENVPFPYKVDNSYNVFNYNEQYFNILSNAPSKSIVANLPSGLFQYNRDKREYFYAYWQTEFNKSVINGSLAYFPKQRLMNDTLCKNIAIPGNLNRLISDNKLTHIVFHKKLVLDDEKNQEAAVRQSPYIKNVYEDTDIIVFQTTNE